MSDAKLKMDWLNAQDPRTFMDLPEIEKAFVDLNRRIKGTSQDEAQTFYEKESMYLKRVIHASWDPGYPDKFLGKCTTFSLYSCFMDAAADGDIISFKPEDKLCYIEKRNYKAGRDPQGQDLWEARARRIISPYGELALRQELGQIAYADPAVVVYEGDRFEIGTDTQSNTVVLWTAKVPRATKKIIGSFIKVTRANGSYITYYMLQEDIDRLAAYSTRQNRGKTNILYGTGEGGTGIDTGFLKAKTLKHALGTFPKAKLRGTNSQMDDMEDGDVVADFAAAQVSQPSAAVPIQQNPYPVAAAGSSVPWDEDEKEQPRAGVYAKADQDEEEIF